MPRLGDLPTTQEWFAALVAGLATWLVGIAAQRWRPTLGRWNALLRPAIIYTILLAWLVANAIVIYTLGVRALAFFLLTTVSIFLLLNREARSLWAVGIQAADT